MEIKGYIKQDDFAVSSVNENKEMEERLLRRCEQISLWPSGSSDARWLAIAKSHFEQGFMALNRAIFQPKRLVLPEDSL